MKEKEIKKDNEKEKFKLVCFSDIDYEEIEWLWKPLLPKGKFVMIAGDPSVGKTFITTYLASVVSKGGNFPFSDEIVDEGGVLILNSEDSNDEIKKRLELSKANFNNIFTITSEDDFIEVNNIDVLRKFILERKIVMLIIDPLNSYLGYVDNSNDTSFRKAMTPIVKLCEELKVTLITVTHFNKGGDKSFYRINGSIAYVGMPRSVIYAVNDYKDENKKIFAQQKCNYSEKAKPISYKITNEGVEWIEQLDSINIEDFTSGEKFSLMQTAKDFILDMLQDGEMEANAFKKEAKDDGISTKTFERARSELKKSNLINKRVENGTTYWFLTREDEQ